MYVLATMRDTITEPPALFGEDQHQVLALQVEKKYANRVVPDVGLCVCFYDLVAVGDSHVYPGDGSAHTDTTFRLVVFRPHENEVLVGKIKMANADGLFVSLGFFDDIHIPPSLMMKNCTYGPRDDGAPGSVWTWEYEGDEEEEGDDAAGGDRLPLYVGEDIRFRVHAVVFRQQGASDAIRDKEGAVPGVAARPPIGEGAESETLEPPLRIVGQLTSELSGASELGVIKWWEVEDEAGAEAVPDEAAAAGDE